jgi:hypothetical protein
MTDPTMAISHRLGNIGAGLDTGFLREAMALMKAVMLMA